MRNHKAALLLSNIFQSLLFAQTVQLTNRQSSSQSALQVTAPAVNSTVLLDEYDNSIRVEWEVPNGTEDALVSITLMRGDDAEELEPVVNADSTVGNDGVHEFELQRTLSRFSACNYTFEVSIQGAIAYSPYFTIINEIDDGIQPGTVCPTQRGLVRPEGPSQASTPSPSLGPSTIREPTPNKPSPDTPKPPQSSTPSHGGEGGGGLSGPELAGIVVGIVCSILGIVLWILERRYGCISARRRRRDNSEQISMVEQDNLGSANHVNAPEFKASSTGAELPGRSAPSAQVAEMEGSSTNPHVSSSNYSRR